MTEGVGVFVIDPPWPQRKGGLRSARPNQGRSLDYNTMSIPDIFRVLDQDVLCHAVPSHSVFLWGVDKFLVDGEREMLARGYKMHCRLIWDKGNGIAPAFTVRFSHEYVTWFYKGGLPKIQKSMRGVEKTVFHEKSRQHSRKPGFLYNMIDRLYPDLVKMDVFSRESRDGWLCYGDEVGKFDKGKS